MRKGGGKGEETKGWLYFRMRRHGVKRDDRYLKHIGFLMRSRISLRIWVLGVIGWGGREGVSPYVPCTWGDALRVTD